ncbi:S8 family peptidase [Chloroflexota bacterium]
MKTRKMNKGKDHNFRWIMLILIVFGLLVGLNVIQVAARNSEDVNRRTSLPLAPFNAERVSQIILKFKDDTASVAGSEFMLQMEKLSAEIGLSLKFIRSMSEGAVVLSLPEYMPIDQVRTIASQLANLPDVEYAEPDAILQHTFVPDDSLYSSQWHYFEPSAGNYGINAPMGWDVTTGSASIVVAVIDTGITSHAEFTGRVVPGYDFITNVDVANDGNTRDSDPSDPGDWITTSENENIFSPFYQCRVTNSSWHGTHTAGTIAANSNNAAGVAGIDWNVKILPIRVLGKCGGSISDIVDGMRWAAGLSVSGVPNNPNPARVLNLSLSGLGSCSTSLQNAVNAITAAGTSVVVSAGNNSLNTTNYQPANCSGVITVAATDRNGNRASYSNYGSTIEISAPGGSSGSSNGVLSTLNTGTQGPVADAYAYYMGTSMSAPHVSGVLSLLLSLDPSLTPSQLLQIIQDNATAFPAGSTCTTSICGDGILNAGASAVYVQPPTFGDVPYDYSVNYGGVDYYLHDHIQALYGGGFTAGCSADPLMYCPGANLNRTEAAVFMLRGMIGTGYSPPSTGFVFDNEDWTDPSISWGRSWAEGMWDEGLTGGCNDSPLQFCPSTFLNRTEGAVFGLRLKYGVGYTPPAATPDFFGDDWTDPSISWGKAWAEQAYKDGLLPACGESAGKPLFCPSDLMTRAWSAYLIVEAKGLLGP